VANLTDRRLHLQGKLVAANQARAVETDIEIAQDVSRLQAACPLFKRVEMPRGIGAANHRADRGADHDIGDDAVCNQGTHDADMGKSAGGTAAQRQTDHRPPNAAKPDLVAGIGALLAAAHPVIQHRKSPSGTNYALQLGPARTYHKHGLCRGWDGLGGDCDWTATPRGNS
jgi:hypothetical protein